VAIRIAIIGFGKIARDQHIPAIAADSRFELVAVSTRSGDPGVGVPCFGKIAQLIEGMQGKLDAVVISTPPLVRHAIAAEAMAAGLAVLLEKPPAATLGEIEDLERRARASGATLYTGWHSQHAAAVAPAAAALRGARVRKLAISWLEDVRRWHPGQDWVWEPAGFGVFDPGINALSIATRILPEPLFVRDARLVVPANRQAPIAAELRFADEDFAATFDWRFEHGEAWTISVATDDGRNVELRDGGARLLIDGTEQMVGANREYPSIYARFAELVEQGEAEVDREPLRIVADACLTGRREAAEAFHWSPGEGEQ